MADSKRESRVVNPIVNEACYCIGQCKGFDREEITFRKQIDSAYKAFGNNDKPSDISIKVTADVNEAITGLKALSRELRETTKAVRELEQAYSSAAEAYKDAEKAVCLSEIKTSLCDCRTINRCDDGKCRDK